MTDLAERIGALGHAIEVMERESRKGGMEGFAAQGSAKVLASMRDELAEQINEEGTKG